MQKFIVSALALATLYAQPAAATVVSAIKITTANPSGEYFRIEELQALQTGTGTNVALASNGATAATNSTLGGNTWAAANAIDGSMSTSYHSGSASTGNYLLITFNHAYDIDELNLFGDDRTDYYYRNWWAYTLLDANSNIVGSGTIDSRNDSDGGTAIVSAPTAVPEPASLGFMATGVAAIAVGSRRRIPAG